MTSIHEISEVRLVTVTSMCDPGRLNGLLKDGWVILSCATNPGDAECDPRTLFALGRPPLARFGRAAA